MSKASNNLDFFLAASTLTVLTIVGAITAVVLIWVLQI